MGSCRSWQLRVKEASQGEVREGRGVGVPGWEGLNLEQSGRWEGSRGPRGQPFGPKHTINSPPLHPLCTLYCDVKVEEKMKDNWGPRKCPECKCSSPLLPGCKCRRNAAKFVCRSLFGLIKLLNGQIIVTTTNSSSKIWSLVATAPTQLWQQVMEWLNRKISGRQNSQRLAVFLLLQHSYSFFSQPFCYIKRRCKVFISPTGSLEDCMGPNFFQPLYLWFVLSCLTQGWQAYKTCTPSKIIIIFSHIEGWKTMKRRQKHHI